MLDVVTGTFYPDLEQALADDVQRIKASDPFSSLLIVVPSEQLRTGGKDTAEHRFAHIQRGAVVTLI